MMIAFRLLRTWDTPLGTSRRLRYTAQVGGAYRYQHTLYSGIGPSRPLLRSSVPRFRASLS